MELSNQKQTPITYEQVRNQRSVTLFRSIDSLLHLSLPRRDLPWPSSWVPGLTWSARRSPRRKASTASSALQRWPASTSCSRSPSPAPPAASPKDSSTCPASLTCSPPPSRRRRPRAAQSCEWRPLGLRFSRATPSPCLFGLGEGGVGMMVLSGLPAESFPHPPGNQTPLRRGGHIAVHLLLNLSAHIHLFPQLLILLSNNISPGLIMELSFLHLYTVCNYNGVTSVRSYSFSAHVDYVHMCNVWRLSV